ncbi:MAG TPA: hypothetical protein VHJ20_18555 [Polyangia bacterium]|nr:hypothetical protein [Polyangia bacterium]
MKMSLTSAALALGTLALGCGGRPDVWSRPASANAYGLSNAVVLHDVNAQRVVALTASGDGALSASSFGTGTDVVATAVDSAGARLFLLSAGHRAMLGDTQKNEAPALMVVDGSAAAATTRTIDLGGVLSDPLDGLALDPTGRWAVLYASGVHGGAFVTNPNELVVVDLTAADGAPVSVSLHSFGGRPEKLVFAPELSLPGGKTHLLIVESEQDLSLLELDHPDRAEITVRLADAAAATTPQPAEIVVDDGDPARTDDARIGLRFVNDTSVMTLQLEPSSGANGYTPTPNVTDVGGVPSAIAFVRTDGGLRLAALVPGHDSAVLVDPATTLTTTVALPADYRSISLVTPSDAASTTSSADTALLWNGDAGQAGVAFWELGQAAGRPFRSLETVAITERVTSVLDVAKTNTTSKVLSTGAAGVFYVLDLAQRTATPLLTAATNVSLVVSPTGTRVWTFAPGQSDLATTDIATKHVRTLHLDAAVTGVFEIGNGGGGRTLVALHALGGLGATTLDATNPDEDHRKIFGALLTEGTP